MPATIAVVCSACHARIKAPVTAAGRRAKCPKCRATVLVPQAPVAADVETVAAAALDDGTGPASEWRSDLPPEPAPDMPLARPSPLPAKSAPAVTRPQLKLVWGLLGVGGGVMAAGLLLIVGLVLTNRERRYDTAAPPGASAPVVTPVERAEVVRKSFEGVVEKARTGFATLAPEPLPKHYDFSWDVRTSSEMTFTGTLGPDALAPVTFDVRETTSLVTPYRGFINFGAKVEGRYTGTLKRDVQLRGSPLPTEVGYPFVLKLDMLARGTAEYAFSDGRWKLEQVRLTPSAPFVTSEESAEKNLFSAMLANELNKKGARPVVREMRLDGDHSTGLGRVLQEAVDR
jgi:DNA-directed RNA polymerase subunit RPC12/RpoP